MQYQKKIEKAINLPANVATVWEKWTTAEGLKSFFAPDCKIELKIGGAFEMYFLLDAEEGSRGSENCKILSFLPQQMLSFSWNAPPQFAAVRNGGEATWIVLQFIAESETSSRLQLTHLGWQMGEEWEQVYAYFDKAWDKVLLWLKECLIAQ